MIGKRMVDKISPPQSHLAKDLINLLFPCEEAHVADINRCGLLDRPLERLLLKNNQSGAVRFNVGYALKGFPACPPTNDLSL